MGEIFHHPEDEFQAELLADMSDGKRLVQILKEHKELRKGPQLTHELQHPEEDELPESEAPAA